MIYSDNQVIGVMRYVTSLSLVDKQVAINILVAVCIGIAILMLVIFTNLFFIRSVVAPVHEITLTAKRIAEGGATACR